MTASLSERITRDLRSKIESGLWPVGFMVPSRRELARNYSVALKTLEQAMAPLIADGSVVTRVPKGTFVAGQSRASLRRIPTSVPHLDHQNRREASVDTAIGIVGAWTGQPQHYYFNNMAARGMEAEAALHPHVTLMYSNRFRGIDQPVQPMIEAVESILAQGAMGLAVLNPFPEDVDALDTLVEYSGIPIVYTATNGDVDRPVRQVTYTSEHAGYEAAKHLLARGWTHITVLQPFIASWLTERISGAQKAVNALAATRHGALDVLDTSAGRSAVEVHHGYEACGYEAGNRLFSAEDRAEGIIAPNDQVAYGVMRAATERGLTAGVDYAIIGFDDYLESRTLGLSTLRPPMTAMGTQAIQMLLAALGGERGSLGIRLPSELVARSSTIRRIPKTTAQRAPTLQY